ncbi:hypothetical protein GCM10007989_03190 [Devosia pacifica]|uniref:Glycosyl hydrolase family 5 n=1 Tax=Devosia pacifica TaxID=1335967 RepID=A0A918RTH1_9HYPH|nr:hypothetical protein GCM10007989_03190 [Devosia pacifica]
MSRKLLWSVRAGGVIASICAALLPTTASAQMLANPIARFAGLDKITARITEFDVYLNETVLFGALEVTPRACYSRSPNETVQRTSAFVEVDQLDLEGESERIFTGWMFADSPALHAVDHAVYDVWLVSCKVTTDVPPPDQR